MTKQEFALSAMKTIEATSLTRDAFRFGRVSRLAKLIKGVGFAFLLLGLSPIASQTISLVDKGDKTPQSSPTIAQKRTLVAGQCITGEVYTMRDGTARDVYMTPRGKRFVLREKCGKFRRYYPKKLSKG